jgi:hypothetical protein
MELGTGEQLSAARGRDTRPFRTGLTLVLNLCLGAAGFRVGVVPGKVRLVRIVHAETLIGVVLTCVLGYYGWSLVKTIWPSDQRSGMARSSSDPSATLGFRVEGGVAVNGDLVFHVPPPRIKTTVVFMLRGASLRADVAFWRGVRSRLSNDAGVRLVGYCDGDACANLVRGAAQSTGFPVIAFGEIVNSESLINADTQGKCILLREEWREPKHVVWRAAGNTPQSVVTEALQ